MSVVKAVLLDREWDDDPGALPPGAFKYFENYGGPRGVKTGLLYVCPCGCGVEGALCFDCPENADMGRPKWKWDGNEEAPTLSPSILRKVGCRWHGHLVAGEWRPC